MRERQREKVRKIEKEIELETIKRETELQRHRNSEIAAANASISSQAKLPKLPVFEETNDCIDSYLQRFERFASNAKWEESIWAINLSALLKGKALEVYSRLPAGEALNYRCLKQALLKRFQLTEEGFHSKFRNSKPEQGESPSQFFARLDNYIERWLSLANSEKTYKGLKDLFLREQFMTGCSKPLAIFLKERHPKSVEEMSNLADQFIEAHGYSAFSKDIQVFQKNTSPEAQKRNNQSSNPTYRPRSDLQQIRDRRCYLCYRSGHIAKDCFSCQKPQRPGTQTHKGAAMQSDGQCEPMCVNCQSNILQPQVQCDISHNSASIGNRAPEENLQFGSACILTDRLMECCAQNGQVKLACGHILPVIGSVCKVCDTMPVLSGYVGDHFVNVLRDSGCNGVVVKRELVKDSELTGKIQKCVLIDGTVRQVEEALIDIDTPFYTGKVSALCMREPVYDLIVGNIPGVRNQSEPDLQWCRRENREECCEILQAVQTRGQKAKDEKGLKKLNVTDLVDLDVTVDKMKELQLIDATLTNYRNLANVGKRKLLGDGIVSWFSMEKGLLYRHFSSPKVSDNKTFKQLVIPEALRRKVMTIALDSILGGHLGTKKTLDRISSSFYWPGIQGDVKRYCQSCDLCQRTFPKGKVTKIPLEKMPLIDTPFERIAVDLVGPI